MIPMQEPTMQTPEAERMPKERIEALMREAVHLYEQNRLDEALLACEGILALDPRHVHALSLKGLIHERRGQIADAIHAYERVLEIDPLSVSERARLEALRAGGQRKRVAARPLWLEAMPAVLAFLGAGLVLMLGFVWLIRATTPPPAPQPASSPATTFAPAPASSAPVQNPSPIPPPTVSRPEPAEGAVPPVIVDPSKVALTPSNPPAPPLTGALPNLPAPQNKAEKESQPESSRTSESPKPQSEVMPDVKVEERDPGVYEIQVHRVGSGEANSSREDPLAAARRYQMAGNYREAIAAYQRALPNAPSPGYVHQQIATCYLRLNEKANARTHFQQAIREYERQISAGRDVESARQGIAACQDGLKLCEE
ncbi:MAG: tetratricopeptide repeat protein [Fimbriimonadales bacterium]|nr:tetratricopeptide repeat protein [Fimbriimonadales bacterium]